MASFTRLRRSAKRAGKKTNITDRLNFADRIKKERKSALELWYELGGKLYISWTKKNYRTYTGDKLRWDEPYTEEIYLLFGNPWFERIVFEKAAQMGFTECLIGFCAFALGYLHIALGVGFETNSKLNEMVGQRIQPAFDYCPKIQALGQERQLLMGRGDIDNKSALTVGGVTCNFFYGKLPGNSKGEQRQAPSKLSSFTAQAILGDEYELWTPAVLDIIEKRMQSSWLISKPMRYGSTPGAEGGLVDRDVKQAQYIFQWHIICPHCSAEQALDAFGNFLKSRQIETEGKIEELFIDPTGRPLDWFYKEEKRKKETAFIGCQKCGRELDRPTLGKGLFKCIKTGISLVEACQNALAQQKIIERSALRMPILASSKFDPVKRIRTLLTSVSPVDEIQQGLGKPASFSSGGIPYKRIEACIGLPLPVDRSPDLRILVIDVGRYGHPAQVQEWYYGEGKTPEEKWLEAHKKIVWYGKIKNLSDDIDYYVKKYKCHIVVMDNEPEFHSAASYALKHPPLRYSPDNFKDWSFDKVQVFLVDQVELKGGKYKRTEREVINTVKNQKVIVYNIDRTWALDMVKTRIVKELQHFPASLGYDPDDEENNLISHYLSSKRNLDSRWVEDRPDHWLQADSMGEAIALAIFNTKGTKRFYVFSAKQID